MDWATLKTLISTIYGQYVGAGNLIEDSSGSPTHLALLLDLVHNRIAGYPNEWPFLKEQYTLTLTGATSYNLATLFPSLKSVYQIYDTNNQQEMLSNYDANIIPIQDGYTIKDKTLTFTGNPPTSGTFTIQGKSKWMVKDSAGTRKQYFTDDTNVTVLDDINVLAFGVGQFVAWTSDDTAKEKRAEVGIWFKEAFANLLLTQEQTRQVNSML